MKPRRGHERLPGLPQIRSGAPALSSSPTEVGLIDRSRHVTYLRLSVLSKRNLHCIYCIPAGGFTAHS